jgi:hypothetical protein
MGEREIWSAEEVRGFLGASSTGSARRTLSRWGVEAAAYRRGAGGRAEARYDAEEVRAAKAARPGRGVRSNPAGAAGREAGEGPEGM